MGYGLLYEGMLDSVIAARDKWMRPPVTNAIAPASRPGFMCPSRATMHLAAVECTEWLADRHDFWNNVYGFDMTSMKEFMQGQAVVDVVEGDSVATSVQTVAVWRVVCWNASCAIIADCCISNFSVIRSEHGCHK